MNYNKHRLEIVCKCSGKKKEEENIKKMEKEEETKRLTFEKILQKGAGLKKF